MSKEQNSSIVVFDTDTDWLEFARTCLTEDGYRVTSLTSIEKLTAALKTIKPAKSLIFMDELSFKEAQTSARAFFRKNNNHHFIVFYDLHFDLQKADDIFKAGASDYLNKPYAKDELLAITRHAEAEIRVKGWKPAALNKGEQGRVLIVEDDSEWYESIKQAASGSGFLGALPSLSFERAKSYEEAKRKIRSKTYDLVISDWLLDDTNMDKMEGIELLHDLRTSGSRNGHTPVIVISAYGTPAEIRSAYKEWNISYFLSKERASYSMFKDSIREALYCGAPA